ncbi:MAG: acetyl-CoA carboxylase biotin carboxyl carrier protein [Actinomycetota bacterium]|jgi:acetyl-CoA carboxylase biotin carboxyl carrier protein|nr:acetyl-CoA carboxylase biotin carboxyl carrier protein [Actinomycetota bacterium]
MSDPVQSGPPRTELIHALCAEAESLIGRLGGPLRSVTIEAGDCVVRVEWKGGYSSVGDPRPGLSPAAPLSADDQAGRHPIRAPLVGTFYRSPEPGSAPFVEEGDPVEANQTIAIIEAMKIMNSITCTMPGRVAEIVVQDGDMVEFEQVLMYIEPPDDSV